MRNSLHLALVKLQGGLDQSLAVACGAGACYGHFRGFFIVDILYRIYRCHERRAVVI